LTAEILRCSAARRHCHIVAAFEDDAFSDRDRINFYRPNVLGVSCAAVPALLRQSGAAVAANDVRRTEWRTATAVTLAMK